jgi:hypothetical protein
MPPECKWLKWLQALQDVLILFLLAVFIILCTMAILEAFHAR